MITANALDLDLRNAEIDYNTESIDSARKIGFNSSRRGGGSMQSSQPMTSPLGILLMIGTIYLVLKSPKRLHTLARMAVGFFVTLLLVIIPGAVLRIGDPQAQGKVGGLVALLVAVIVGWWHVRSLRRSGKESIPTPVD